jgi:hypothetical protein
VELQENLNTFQSNNVQICAISYDPVEVLQTFSEKHGITYPLLSDTRSDIIRKFGILNTLVPEDHAWYGVPFPGTYIVDENGKVTDTSFYANHGVRDSIPRMLSEHLHISPDGRVVQKLENDTLTATAELSAGSVRRGQIQTFTLEIETRNGRHLHAKPLPEGYLPTELSSDLIEDVAFGEVEYPPGQPFRLEALGETLHIYKEHLTLKASVKNLRREPFTLVAHLHYQACDDRECHLPDHLRFEIPVSYLENA